MALRTLLTRKPLATVPRGVGIGMLQSRSLKTFTLPDLPYYYEALEPAISGQIMQLHHQKHHQTYVTNYNKALEQLAKAMTIGDAPTIAKLQSTIKFNSGGHINHSIFWKNLAPEGGGEPPKGSLCLAIESNFGSFEALIQKMNAEGAALHGSVAWFGQGVHEACGGNHCK
ncbi:aspartate--tRNA ligase msd1, variant 2 [Ancistrocladus abbreviatus]